MHVYYIPTILSATGVYSSQNIRIDSSLKWSIYLNSLRFGSLKLCTTCPPKNEHLIIGLLCIRLFKWKHI